MCELLQGSFDPIVSSDGYEALRTLAADPSIPVVLLDVEMPGMSGIEAVRRIRADARFADTAVIAMTAHDDASDRERLAAAGMDDHVAKPIDPERLAAAIGGALARSRKEREAAL